MEPHHPILRPLLFIAAFFGVASLQDIDIALAVILKCVSIISFGVAIAYAIWKWRTEYKKENK